MTTIIQAKGRPPKEELPLSVRVRGLPVGEFVRIENGDERALAVLRMTVTRARQANELAVYRVKQTKQGPTVWRVS